MRIGILVYLIFISGLAFSQNEQVTVTGKFFEDRLHIGEEIRFTLSARHPSNLNVLFPNTKEDFGQFEVTHHKYFQTQTKDSISLDSAVYFLRTFNTKGLQSLSVPLYVLHEKDCTLVYSSKDSIKLASLIPTDLIITSLDTLPLKEQVYYFPIRNKINFQRLISILGLISFSLISIIIWFGKPFFRRLKIKKVKKLHDKFLVEFERNKEKLHLDNTKNSMEELVVHWKRYLETLEDIPFTKLTTLEIQKISHRENLHLVLKQIDRFIYGNKSISDFPSQELKDYAIEMYNQKLANLNG